MLEEQLNGLFLPEMPASMNGVYRFSVMERYYEQARGGKDLTTSYKVSLPTESVQFLPSNFEQEKGVVMSVKPGALAHIERQIVRNGADDAGVYPVFES